MNLEEFLARLAIITKQNGEHDPEVKLGVEILRRLEEKLNEGNFSWLEDAHRRITKLI